MILMRYIWTTCNGFKNTYDHDDHIHYITINMMHDNIFHNDDIDKDDDDDDNNTH